MNKILKLFAILIAFLVVFTSCTLIYLQYFIDLNSYKKTIENKINSNIDGKIGLVGDLSWNLFPLFSVRVQELNFTQKGYKITANNVAIYPKVSALLNKEFIIKKMQAQVFGGQINAAFSTSFLDPNSWNLNANGSNLSTAQIIRFAKQGRNFSQSGKLVSYLMSNEAKLDGNASFRLNMRAKNLTGNEYLSALSGSASLDIRDISYKVQMFAPAMIAGLLTNPTSIANLDYTPLVLGQNFNRLTFSGSMANGVLRDDLRIYSAKYSVDGKGNIDLKNNRILGSYDAYINTNGKKSLLTKCSGSLDSPNCTTPIGVLSPIKQQIQKIPGAQIPGNLLNKLPF